MPQEFIYILKSSKDGKHYIGHTSDLIGRLVRHNSGENRSTKYRGKLNLVYYERLSALAEAVKKEKYIKDLGVKRFLAKNLQ